MYSCGGELFSNIIGMERVLNSQRTGFLKGNKPKVMFFYSPKVLLPLFSLQNRPKDTDNINLNIQLIKFIAKIVQGHDYYQNEMHRTQFFPIMGYLLSDELESVDDTEMTSPANIWSPEAVNELEALGNVICSHKLLFKHFYYHILLNFKIWVRTPFQVQHQLLSCIQARAVANPTEFRSLVKVSYFIDLLTEYYSVVYDKSRLVAWDGRETHG
jgi:hypothetical protein